VDHREIIDGPLFVARCQSSGLLAPVDQTFDAVALAMGTGIDTGLAALIGAGRDDRANAALGIGVSFDMVVKSIPLDTGGDFGSCPGSS
jgi:hypothetical protein